MLFQSTAIDLYIYNRFFFFFILCKQQQQCFSDIIRFIFFGATFCLNCDIIMLTYCFAQLFNGSNKSNLPLG